MSRKGYKVVSCASLQNEEKKEKYTVFGKLCYPINLFFSLHTPGFGFSIAY